MAEETQNADLQAAESKAKGMAALGTLSGDAPADAAPQVPAEPKIDNLGRSYATGRRKHRPARALAGSMIQLKFYGFAKCQ